jgi:uncharacterized protein
MSVSDAEKLVLVMLSEIYKHLKIKGNIDPELVLTTIFNDQMWGLKWEYGGIFTTPSETPPVVRETCDILDMYRVLTPSFNALSPADQKRIKTEGDPFDEYVKYQGFDGNNDPHLGVVSYLVKTLKRYEEIKHPDLNSHSIATIQHYRRMLSIYHKVRDHDTPKLLTADQIIQTIRGGR